MEPISTEELNSLVTTAYLDALVTLCASGDRIGRHKARRELLDALRADGYKPGKAKLLADVWTAERKRMLS